MPTIYKVDPVEVDNRLEELGWTRAELIEVVGTMVSARRNCTENDPSSAPGWMAWKDGTRRIRELATPRGLVRAEVDQIPCVLDSKRHLRFSVTNTDDGTAIKGRTPQNRSRKGAATDRVVSINQTSLFDYAGVPLKVIPLSSSKPQPGLTVSWFLCVYCEGEEIRAELSCPVEVEAGFFSEFSERIILIGPDDEGAPVRREIPDDGEQFDIPVTRK